MTRQRLAGTVVIVAAIAVGAYAALNPGVGQRLGSLFSKKVTVRAQFDRATRVSGAVDRNVRMDGVNVGRIVSVERAPGSDDAIVEMELDAGKAGRIGRDARAFWRPHTAFEGTTFVDLEPGSPSAPPLADRVIPPSQTRSYVSMDEVLRTFRPPTRKALQDDVRGLDHALGGQATNSLQGMFHDLPPLLRDGRTAARATRGVRGHELRRAIRGMAATTAVLAGREQDLAPLLRQGGRTFQAFDVDSGAALDATLRQAPAALNRMLSAGRNIRRVVDRLEPLAIDLEPALADSTATLRQLRPLLRETRPVARQAPPFIDDLRLAVDRGAASAPPTRELMRQLNPALVRLRDEILPKLHESMTTAVVPGRIRTKVPRDVPPAFDTPVYQALTRGLAQSGSGALSVKVDPQENANTPGRPGIGYGGYRFAAKEFFGLPPGTPEGGFCGQLPPGVRDLAVQAGICPPPPISVPVP
jgi:ABC-type transporter Mla subunit MlaD